MLSNFGLGIATQDSFATEPIDANINLGSMIQLNGSWTQTGPSDRESSLCSLQRQHAWLAASPCLSDRST